MKLFAGLGGIAASVMFAVVAGAAALPFPDGNLLPNAQHLPVDVALDGVHAAVILPGAVPRMFEKNGGGTWINQVDFPAGALAISIRDGAPPMTATSYGAKIELRSYDAGEDTWDLADTIVLAAGERATRLVLQDGILAAIVEGNSLDEEISARIFRNNAGDWILAKSIEMDPPPPEPGEILLAGAVTSLDLNGTRLAIGSVGLGQVWIHEQNSGGTHNWGRVAIVPTPSGQTRFGSALALENDRLAVVSVDAADGKPDVTAFERNTGGANAWGKTGIVLSGAGAGPTSLVMLDMTDSRLVALSAPGFADVLGGASGGHAWFFATGGGPSGWVEEAQQDFGQIFLPTGLRPLVALDGSECLVGLTDEEYLDSHGASWATCVQRRGTGQWNRVQLLEGPGGPQELGKVIAMCGNYLVAGMPGDDGTGSDSGAVMIWAVISLPTNGDRWFPVARLECPAPAAGQRFGASVAISVNGEDDDEFWVAVGAPGTNANRGAVYLFDLTAFASGGAPAMLVRTPAAGLSPDDQFGASVALSRRPDLGGPLILAAGAAGKNGADTDSGVVYLFKQDLGGANAWGEWKTISRPLIPGGKFFGDRVALAGEGGLAVSQRPVAGVPGRVYLFSQYQGGTDNWGLIETISAPPGAPNRFAESISASGFGVVVGAPGGSSGRVYHYVAVGGTPAATFGDVTSSPEFGAAVSISDNSTLLVGDPGANSGAGRLSAWTLTSMVPITWSPHFKCEGQFGSGMGSAAASSLIYCSAGAPFTDAAGSDYGAIEVYRAGSYERWAANQGAGFNAWFPDEDADGDGQTNLVEFALGSNPRSGARGIFLMNRATYTSGPTSYPAMRFVRPGLPYSTSAMHLRIERNDDLGSWFTARYDHMGLADPGARYFRADAPRGFFRLSPKYPDFNPEVEGGILTPVE